MRATRHRPAYLPQIGLTMVSSHHCDRRVCGNRIGLTSVRIVGRAALGAVLGGAPDSRHHDYRRPAARHTRDRRAPSTLSTRQHTAQTLAARSACSAEAPDGYSSTQTSRTGCCVMESYTPEWRKMSDIADTIRRARLVMADAQEVRLTSFECRHRAAVLCQEAERLRAGRGASMLHGTKQP
jgi:hypothetical protein